MVAEPTLRVMTPDEAPAVVALMEKIHWFHPLEQTRNYITFGGQGSFCLAFDDQIVATAIALKYSSRLGWVGLVVSDPDYQRRGFARRLMNHVMEYFKDVDSIMLDASALGYPLYESMGFQNLYKINAYTGQPAAFAPVESVRKIISSDLSTVIALDCDVFGLPRTQVFNWLYETGQGYSATENGQITGYAFTKSHADTMRAIAWHAQTPAVAEALLQVCSTEAAAGGFTLRLNVPELNPAAASLAAKYNLTVERFVRRMVYGQPPPGHMADQYGIISFMTG